MGIRYGKEGLVGERVFDFLVDDKRLYELLDYTKYNLIVFGEHEVPASLPPYINLVRAPRQDKYPVPALMVRPDSYILDVIEDIEKFTELKLLA
jgi:hypothetical protein